MTRRALRIATTLIIIQSLLFFPAPVSRAQDGLTQAEIILAKETADLFMKRLDETGDFSSVIDEMYVEDFIERYIQQQMHEGKESDSFTDIYFAPGKYKRDLLKLATVEDWRRLYIAANNFMYHIIITGLNKHADDFLNGRELDDETADKCIPSKVIELFNNHPILKGSFGFDDGKLGESNPAEGAQRGGAQEESGPKSVETPEEMQDVTETLQEGLRLLLDDQGDHSIRLTDSAKSALAVNTLKLEEKGLMEPMIEVNDKKFLGLLPGTRILAVPTPFRFWLEIAEVNGKHKIVRAQFWPD
ncbi:MAG TPA: hypothetical protein VJZ77_12025 [Blastocatellia bacterium]|nr:hypothetical protein [Blastocatellia bacterium]